MSLSVRAEVLSRPLRNAFEAAGPDAVVVKSTSHRSRQRLQRVTENLSRPFFSFERSGEFYVIPAADATAATAITGITRSRRHDDLLACWQTTD